MIRWKLHLIFVQCLLALSNGTPDKISEEPEFDIIYPEQIHPHRSRRDLSTKGSADLHDDKVTFKIPIKNREQILDLNKISSPVHAGSVRIGTQKGTSGEFHFKDHVPEDCHFQGQIRGNSDSHLYISTCNNKLKGTIDDGKNIYDIEPHGDNGSHKFYQVDHVTKEILKRLKRSAEDSLEIDAVDVVEGETNESNYTANPHKFPLIDVEPQYKKYLTTNRTRYLEMFVTADHGMYKHYKSDELVLERVLNTLGQIDVSYQAIGIRIVLVGLEIQHFPTFNRSRYANQDLRSYKDYVHDVIKKSSAYKNIRFDNAQLLSSHGWTSYAGMAFVGTLCDASLSVAVNAWTFTSRGPVVTIGHELGHNLNFLHDSKNCICLTPRGCFMGGGKSARPGFSDCSLKRLAKAKFGCINDYPIAPIFSVCGNGIRDPGEECDCGTPENCLKKGDHCCQPKSCRLKTHAQCSHLNNPGCCSEKCFFRKQGTLCRNANGECDVEEYCTGESAQCPKDLFARNGFPCDSNQRLFGAGKNRIHTIELPQPIIGQYFRYVPQKWHSRSCMQLEMLGCDLGGDCELPLVSSLPRSAFSGGPSLRNYPPYKVSFADIEEWCSEKLTEGSWVQIDLRKPKSIRKIQIKGRSTNWVLTYNLYFSTDGISWQHMKETLEQSWEDKNSACFNGKCATTYNHQCQELWDKNSKKGNEKCWKEFNVKANGYGTCDPLGNVPCQAENIYCGQLQCSSPKTTPTFINFGSSYAIVDVQNETCNAATITNNDEVGFGMVADGTLCGNGKICMNQECKTYNDHGIKTCSVINGKECNGNGKCNSDGVCQCNNNFNPMDGCVSELPAVDGGWSDWSSWTMCTKACSSGTRSRNRWCNQPVPKHGGIDCQGSNVENTTCNQESCPIEKSCRRIKSILEKQGKPIHDGVYKISLRDGSVINAYCDMTSDGGGWTLLVSSHTNTWTSDNVRSRNEDKPSLTTDYSILRHGDDIKYHYLIAETTFEYKLEAFRKGQFGGIWKAPSHYQIDSANKHQGDVTLLKKFGNWVYKTNGLQERLPYVFNQKLTLSSNPSLSNKTETWGSITDNSRFMYPAYWIEGPNMMTQPEHIWYWMREGDYRYPQSCLEVLFRGFHQKIPYKSGVYKIEINGNVIETYCDLERYGGGWTLVTKSSSRTGWTKDLALERNSNNVSSDDYSIFKYINDIKNIDPAETSFQYMLEGPEENQNGGIFSVPTDFSLLISPKGIKPKLLKKFGDWNESVENFLKHPIHLTSKPGIFLSISSEDLLDKTGSVISNKAGSYMTTLKNLSKVSLWVREAGSRQSCNDLKIHGFHKGKMDYKDGFYLIQKNQIVYCDMETTKNEGWTLLVSSVSTNWTRDQVLERNLNRPSLYSDYSMLNKADFIKSLSNNGTFKYMLDAKRRRHWGGIWKAPIHYSFVQKSDRLNQVDLMEQFNQWEYNRWGHPAKRMPYLGNSKNNRSLLTTGLWSQPKPWGTIIAAKTDGEIPAKWMYKTIKSPGAIWYWINENDCHPNYQKVDADFSEWSSWTACSSVCGEGLQKRTRLCNSPVPRCGGNHCAKHLPRAEQRPCIGNCRASKITTLDSRFCMQPENGGCNPTDNTKIVLREASKCFAAESDFVFDAETGELLHKCSNMPVCLRDGKTIRGTNLIVNSTCHRSRSHHYFKRTFYGTLQYGTLCLDPSGPTNRDGVNIVLWTGCHFSKRQFQFEGIGHGAVKVSFYDSMKKSKSIQDVIKAPAYPNSPTRTGWMDGLDTPRNIAEYYALRVQSLFIAPQTGEYVFAASCDDKCSLYLSSTKHAINKVEIINLRSWTNYHQWTKYKQQNSSSIFLHSGRSYYIEGVLLEYGNIDHMSIGVYFPDGTSALPITSHYLGKIEGGN